MHADAHRLLIQRLAKLKASPDCIRYLESVQLPIRPKRRFSAYGIYPTNEILLEVTDGIITRVNHFFSRHKAFPPDERRQDMPLVDIADAHALARRMCRFWPDEPLAPGKIEGYRD